MGRRNISDAPWITKDGAIDISKLSLEYNFEAATGSNRQSALESIRVLKLATHHVKFATNFTNSTKEIRGIRGIRGGAFLGLMQPVAL